MVEVSPQRGQLSQMANTSTSKTGLARRAWGLMFDYLMRTAPERSRGLGRRGLTPNDARAISSLDPAEGRSMRSLANAWECDPSNATWIVDRLVRRGLAERRDHVSDRRVKLVVLTRKGKRTRSELLAEFHTPPADLLEADGVDLEALANALERVIKRQTPNGT
jgi:MarR family transcriptional regulator, organic hydroperoxide resistance regulator